MIGRLYCEASGSECAQPHRCQQTCKAYQSWSERGNTFVPDFGITHQPSKCTPNFFVFVLAAVLVTLVYLFFKG